MKTLKLNSFLLIIFFMPFLAFSQSPIELEESGAGDKMSSTQLYENTLNAPYIEVEKMHKESFEAVLSGQLYASYTMFKLKEFEMVISMLAEVGYDSLARKSIKIEPRGSVDSLIFSSSNDSKVIFTMVDLGYIQNVTASMVIRKANSEYLMQEFERSLVGDGLVINADFYVPNVCAEFKSKGEYWIVDNRWQKKTYTKFDYLYNHLMSKYDDYFVINFTETVPEEWVDKDEYYGNKVDMNEDFSKGIAQNSIGSQSIMR